MGCNAMLVGAYKLRPFLFIFGVSLLIAGCCFCIFLSTICTKEKTKYKYEKIFVHDYTDCIKYDNDEIVCHENMKNKGITLCICTPYNFNLSKDLLGDVVIMYELETFNNSNVVSETSNFFQSRDDNQLNGLLSNQPSKACGSFAYDENNRTIAPCGALADAMFNDVFILVDDKGDMVPTFNTGLVLDIDKKGFHNPSPQDNLRKAFANYSSPKSWEKKIWELDVTNPDNNGFQNEAFIAWMNTDWSLKPILRLNQTNANYTRGLPEGNYSFHIEYHYPTYKYEGKRKVVIATREAVEEESCHSAPENFDIGLLALIIGLILLLILAGLTWFNKKNGLDSTESVNTDVNEVDPAANITLPKKSGSRSLLDQGSSGDHHGKNNSYTFNEDEEDTTDIDGNGTIPNGTYKTIDEDKVEPVKSALESQKNIKSDQALLGNGDKDKEMEQWEC